MNTTAIIDVSHWEYDRLRGAIEPALAKARAAGIVAVIAKCTQGKDLVDSSWSKFARAIIDAGLLLGSYHFGSNTAPGDTQADFYLRNVAAVPVEISRTVLCLDFENNPKPAWQMGPCEVRAFMHRVHAVTGQRPLLYGSNLVQQFKNPADVLGEFPLWIAAYGPTRPKIPKAWDRYALHQYTDGPLGPPDQTTWPRDTPGFGRIDRSVYQGTEAELRAAWPQL